MVYVAIPTISGYENIAWLRDQKTVAQTTEYNNCVTLKDGNPRHGTHGRIDAPDGYLIISKIRAGGSMGLRKGLFLRRQVGTIDEIDWL